MSVHSFSIHSKVYHSSLVMPLMHSTPMLPLTR